MVNKVQRLTCISCGLTQRVKTNVDTGAQTICYGCGPTTWLSVTLAAPKPITMDPDLDFPTPQDYFWAKLIDKRMYQRMHNQMYPDPDAPENQPWWNDD